VYNRNDMHMNMKTGSEFTSLLDMCTALGDGPSGQLSLALSLTSSYMNKTEPISGVPQG